MNLLRCYVHVLALPGLVSTVILVFQDFFIVHGRNRRTVAITLTHGFANVSGEIFRNLAYGADVGSSLNGLAEYVCLSVCKCILMYMLSKYKRIYVDAGQICKQQ